MPGIGRAWHEAARLNSLQSLLAHQPSHPMPAGFTPQFGGDSPRTVATRVLPKDLFYFRGQWILPFWTLFPGVVTATTHAEQLTQNHRRESGRLARDKTIDQGHVCRLKVGSSTGAVLRGSPFPVPAASNGAGGFPALRFPQSFFARVMWLIGLAPLSGGSSEPGSHCTAPVPRTAIPYSTASSRSPSAYALASSAFVLSSRSSP